MVRAPEFPKDSVWLNTDRPLSLEALRGHVVLLDFWTYCCINCIHVLPDLAYLEKKYEAEPFVVIGVHSAKFHNEQDPENIRNAIARYEIEHPVYVDSDHRVWDAYVVNAWPTFILIGADGRVVAKGSGEGLRDALDRYIGEALADARDRGILAKRRIDIRRPPLPEHPLSFPGKLAFHPTSGHLFVTDSNHNRIMELKVNGNRAKIVQIIGSGRIGAEDGHFDTATFYRPQGLAVTERFVYVCDTENHMIRRLDLVSRTVETLAGTGEQAHWGATGGHGPATPLNSPWDCTLVGDHQLYIAMAGPHQLWKLDLSTQQVNVFAGSGWENIVDGPAERAQLAQPSGIAHDGKRLYFVDSEVSALRTCDLQTGDVNTLIGRGLFVFGLKDGDFDSALLQHPLGLDVVGNQVYIADTYNHAIRVAHLPTRRIETLITRSDAKTCRIGDESCAVLPLNEPNDVRFHENKLYITDTNNHLIRVYDLHTRKLETLEWMD